MMFKTENVKGIQELLYNPSFKAWFPNIAWKNQIMDASLSSYIKIGIQIEQKYPTGTLLMRDFSETT